MGHPSSLWSKVGYSRNCRGLRVVVTAHAVGGVAMAAGLSPQSRFPSGTIEVMRKHVFIDTTLIHPAVIRACVDLLGANNVLAGSDFPIAGGAPIRAQLSEAMRQARLSQAEQNAIAAGNCLQLLDAGTPALPNVQAIAGGIS
jgi:hypothetical protein